jgi:hypothetical protein
MNSTIALIIAFIATLIFGMAIGFMFGLTKGIVLGSHLYSKRSSSPIAWVLSLILSGILMLSAVGTSIYSIYFITSSVQTQATVTELIEHKDEKGHLSWYPVYSYTAAGEQFSDRSSIGGGGEYAVGNIITIRYLKNQTNRALMISLITGCYP